MRGGKAIDHTHTHTAEGWGRWGLVGYAEVRAVRWPRKGGVRWPGKGDVRAGQGPALPACHQDGVGGGGGGGKEERGDRKSVV